MQSGFIRVKLKSETRDCFTLFYSRRNSRTKFQRAIFLLTFYVQIVFYNFKKIKKYNEFVTCLNVKFSIV